MCPNTERDYRKALDDAGLLEGDAEQLPELAVLRAVIEAVKPEQPLKQRESSVEKWRAEISKLVDEGATPKAIHDHLTTKPDSDFSGSLSAVKRMCAQLRADKHIAAKDVAIPVDTEPGDVAQVDFGFVGKLWDPETKRVRPAYVFVMVLAFSRHMFAKLVFDQTVETWQALTLRRSLAWLLKMQARGQRRPAGRPTGACCSSRGSRWRPMICSCSRPGAHAAARRQTCACVAHSDARRWIPIRDLAGSVRGRPHDLVSSMPRKSWV